MKAGFQHNQPLRRLIAAQQARLITEAVVEHAQDRRQTQAHWDAGTKSNVTSYADGRLTLTPTTTSAIEQTAGTDNITDLDDASPYTYVAVEFAGSLYGANPTLRKVECYLDLQPNAGTAPFDGEFVLHVCRVARLSYSMIDVKDFVGLQPVAASPRVKASDQTSLAGYVAFTFPDSPYAWGAHPPVLDRSWVPTSARPTQLGSGEVYASTNHLLYATNRMVVLVLEAVGGTNTNYAWKKNAAEANPYTAAGNTIRYVTAAATVIAPASGMFGGVLTAGAGCPRMKVHASSYAATGTETITGYDLGAAPTGTVEFRVTDNVPSGCTGQAYVRVPSGPGAWIAFVDGQTPAAIGIASQQTYDMKYELASDSTLTATPELWLLGVVDVTAKDLTEISTWSEYDESVDVLTGQVKMAEAELTLDLTGLRDYRDIVTTLLSTYHPTQLQIRTFVGGGSLTRGQYGTLDLWDVDDVRPGFESVTLVLVSVLNRLKGRFPRASGTQTGYVMKTAASDLSGGADFTKELSLTTETASTVAATIAASATEVQYAFTPLLVPGLIRWPDGAWTVKVSVNTGNSNLYMTVRLVRVNAAGTVQETRPAAAATSAEEQQLTAGVKTFTFGNITWTEGAAAGTDRLLIQYSIRNAAGTPQAVTFDTGTVNTEVLPPWVPATSVSPQVFSSVYPGSAYATWRDSVVGLPARFRGSVPDTNRHRISKAILDAEGKRELERIAWLDGCLVHASQGTIQVANLWGPRERAVAVFSTETATVRVDRGFTARLPEFACEYGYDRQRPRAFMGQVKAQHVASFAAYGSSRVDNPDQRPEEEIERYVEDAALAGEIARAVVRSMGAGYMTAGLAPIEWMPHLTLGDAVAFETDTLALKDPVSGEAVRGWVWALGTVIGTTGWRRSRLKIWFRLTDLYATTDSVQQRLPYEGPLVAATVTPNPASLASVSVKAKCSSSTATIYYYQHATGTAPPSRDRLELWTVYSTTLNIARDASADVLLSFFARDGGFTGAIATYRIGPDATAQILSLSAIQAGASPNITVTFTATADSDTRAVRLYWRKDSAGTAWPTVDGTAGAAVSETYFMKEVRIAVAAGGFYADGTTVAGGNLSTTGQSTSGGAADLCASTNYVQCVAVPIDYNGNAGTRLGTSYDVQAAAGASLSVFTWTLNTGGTSCALPRKYNFAWTPVNVVDGTHDLLIYATVNGTRELIKTEVSPNGTTTATAVAISGYAAAHAGYVDVVFDYELVIAGPVTVDSGVSDTGADGFNGETCL